MPLIKSSSPKAFQKNISREMHSGKPQKQAVAIAYSVADAAKKKHHSDEHAGESTIAKRPSNSSTGMANSNTKTGKSFAEQPQPHSRSSAKRSEMYHSKTVEPNYTRPSSMKMTKAEHQLNNDEDMSEKGHKL